MQYLATALSERFDHPLLVTMFAFAGVFAATGLVLELVGSNAIAAAFFGVYAILAALLGVLGFAILYLVRYVSRLRDQAAPHVS